MRFTTVRNGLVCASLLCFASTAFAAEPAISWAKSYSDAMSTAKQTHKLVMADFYTDWCVWCKKLDSDTYTDKKVIKLSEQVVPVKVNAEKEGVTVAKKYNVQGYPTILFLNDSGEVEGRIGGYMPADGFSQQVALFLTAHKELPILMDRVKKDPNDLEATVKLEGIYAGRGDAKKAADLITKLESLDAQKTQPYMAKAYNDLGDAYQTAQQFAPAIETFGKALKAGTKPFDLAYSHISIAVCNLSQNKVKEAIPDLKAIVDAPDAPADLKKTAQEYLDQIHTKGLDK